MAHGCKADWKLFTLTAPLVSISLSHWILRPYLKGESIFNIFLTPSVVAIVSHTPLAFQKEVIFFYTFTEMNLELIFQPRPFNRAGRK